MRQRDVSLDIIRIVACVFVVAMHSPMPSDNANGVFLVALSYFTAPCNGLFFMVSGALLLPVKKSIRHFSKKDSARFYGRHYFGRLYTLH